MIDFYKRIFKWEEQMAMIQTFTKEFLKKTSKCWNDPYLPYLQEFFEVISHT